MGSIIPTDFEENEVRWAKPHQLLQGYTGLKIQDTPRDHFSRLPLEIIKFIFEYLDPVKSICLGLVGRTFYSMYKLTHRYPLRLDTPWKRGMAGNPTMLHGFLEGWAAGNRCRLFRRYSASGPPRLIFEKLPKDEDYKEPQPV